MNVSFLLTTEVLVTALGTPVCTQSKVSLNFPGCTQSKVSLNFVLCSKILCRHYTRVYTIKSKSEFCAVLKKLYADTAIVCSKHPICCFHWDNVCENFSAEAIKWMTYTCVISSSLTPHEQWQNGRTEEQIPVLLQVLGLHNMLCSWHCKHEIESRSQNLKIFHH